MNTISVQATLENKLASLKADVDAWLEIVTKPEVGKPNETENSTANNEARNLSRVFAKHQSQIVRLHDLFKGMIQTIESDIAGMNNTVADSQNVFQSIQKINHKILQGHALWAYFRNKLLLRCSSHIQRYLSAADEFAWACFKPLSVARQAVAGSGHISKVPPLIYLGRDISPLVYPRDWSLQSQIPDVSDQVYSALVSKAPFSVVSMPFYQTAHLPESMLLAHEMGHVVEMDLKLSNALDAALDNIPKEDVTPEHKAIWKRCRIEAFADVFGAAVGGVAFCQALASFLAKESPTILKEDFGSSPTYAYPTKYLRVLLVLEVWRQKGTLEPAFQAIETEWRTAYGNNHLHKDFEKDLPAIVRCFIDTSFPELNSKSIRFLAALSAKDNENAAQSAKGMLQYKEIPQLNDPRLLFAAATIAFHNDPRVYQDNQVANLVLTRIEAVADNAPRSATSVTNAQQADLQAGASLAKLL